ncbi:hypothetical protein HY087_02450 [Candidatus Gottesmanbacteria bacterium]|nr:hypothetical protein [Candidatus Gottesmanbacteria bacterium]
MCREGSVLRPHLRDVFIIPKETDRLDVSRTVSILAVLYEKARNAVEFRADHLIRRAAIERILKRRIMLNGGGANIAEQLIVELLWARYIDSSLVDNEKSATIQGIIDRYLALKHHSGTSLGSHVTWDTLVGLASSEIEETIVSARKRIALTNFFYQAIRPKVALEHTDAEYSNMLIYIAVERAYAQSDDALVTYHLLRVIYPDWFSATAQTTAAHRERLFSTVSLIAKSFRDPAGDRLFRYVRSHTPPYLLIRDFFMETGDIAREILGDQSQLEQKLAEIAARRYQEIGNKVRRAVVRSFIYIFLTKMVFALALEAPYDVYIAKKITYLPLAVNMLFPPALLFLVAGLFSVPGTDNTKRLIDAVKTILFRFDSLKHQPNPFVGKQQVLRPLLTAIFSVFYLTTYAITFGLIHWGLKSLHFSLASEVIFVFFIALVSFFAYRIRLSAKEYEMVDRQGILEPLFDFFFLPILRAGHILTREIAKINIFIFLFDFVLEAPLKVIFEVVEEWIRFVRIKKEEII